MKKYINDFEVVRQHAISEGYFTLELKCCEPLPKILPGQFVQVLVNDSSATYLRRPFSIYNVDYTKNELSLLIKVTGAGTLALSKLKEGEILNLIYPLGNTFTMPQGKKALLVGGGVGIAPMLLLSTMLHTKGYKPDILIGGRTSGDILEPERYMPYGNVFITTDDGSSGEKGMVTQHPVFKRLNNYSAIYACGPNAMMNAIGKEAAWHNIPCEVSLENTMACGIGVCLCCVVATKEGNKTSCTEGPIFDTRRLAW